MGQQANNLGYHLFVEGRESFLYIERSTPISLEETFSLAISGINKQKNISYSQERTLSGATDGDIKVNDVLTDPPAKAV